ENSSGAPLQRCTLEAFEALSHNNNNNCQPIFLEFRREGLISEFHKRAILLCSGIW
ncbi:hypothetical protein SK128_003704, partial [Halocaridina rubra]